MKKIIKTINDSNNILIIGHKRPDGDSIGSCIAMYYTLKERGKNASILNGDAVPESFEFINKGNIIKNDCNEFIPDLIIYLDSATEERVGDNVSRIIDNFGNTICINIDHHPNNPKYCELNYIDSKASSTCEMLYGIFNTMNVKINSDIAEALLMGMVTDTGFFKFDNVSSETMKIASILMEKGADLNKIAHEIEMNRPVEEIHLTTRVYERMTFIGNKVYSYIKNSDFVDIGAKSEYTDGIVNQLLYQRNIDVAVLIIEDGDNIRMSFRGKGGKYDLNALAGTFGGGGHINASGAFIKKGVLIDTIEIIEKLLDDL